MSTLTSDIALPAAALVFPLLLGAVLVVTGAAALLSREAPAPSPTAHPLEELLPWMRVVVGALLLTSSGTTFALTAILATIATASALGGALEGFSRGTGRLRTGAVRVAGQAALLAVSCVTAIEGVFGFDGVPAHLARFDLRDLSWAAALIGVVVVSSLLQHGASGDVRRAESTAVPSPDTVGATWTEQTR